jgi:transposase
MKKQYIVTLPAAERAELEAVIKKRSAKSPVVRRAYVLLAADTLGKAMKDAEIARQYHVSVRTVERLRERWVEQGLDVALNGKKQLNFKPKTFDGTVEAQLIAMRCSDPPEGYQRWTYHLLADQMVVLGHVKSISHETARQILKKMRSSRGPNAVG